MNLAKRAAIANWIWGWRRWVAAVGLGLVTAVWATAPAAAAPGALQKAVTAAAPTTPVAQTAVYTVNVPLLEAPAGDPRLDANFWAVVWLGEVSGAAGAYADVRLVGRTDGLLLRAQVYDAEVADDDALTLAVNGRRWRVPYGEKAEPAAGWEVGERCGNDGCRGWGVDALIPWAKLGGRPQAGDVWPLRVRLDDAGMATGTGRQAMSCASRPPAAWPPVGRGVLQWGLPGAVWESTEPAGAETQHATGVQVVEVPLSADSMVGGGTDCGVDDYPDYFPTWGSRNFGDSPHANVQMQWDIADWPCYSKYYAAWPLAALPPGAEVLTATLVLRQFGNPGYGPGYAEDGTKDTLMQVYEVREVWEEDAITWDSAPVPHENVARTLVQPLPGDCTPTPYWYCAPGIPYEFDITEIVRRAQSEGRNWASAALYTAAGQYHAGKFFWSREGQEPPVVRIAYRVAEGRRRGAVQTAAGGTGSVATAALLGPSGLSPQMVGFAAPAQAPTSALTPVRTPGRTFYVALRGNDANPGSRLRPWKTFARAWETLEPGDTLVVGDGRYTEPLQPNVRNGEPGKPITIKAQHDGAVTIDGQGQVVPVKLGDNWGAGGPFGDWYVLEGVVVRNGLDHVLEVRGSHNVVRRVSVYDGDVNDNTVNLLLWGNDNLVEDCVVSGTGRYMINVYNSTGNTVRRCFTMWRQWDGRHFCGVTWPNGNNIGVYGASDTTVENAIAYGRGLTGIFIQANADEAVANNNQVLGSMALLQGRDLDGSQWQYGAGVEQPVSRPGPTSNRFGGATCDDAVTQWEWGNFRQGFSLWGQGELRDNVFRDVLAAGNVGTGWGSGHPSGPGPVNLVLDHMTLYDNGADVPSWEGQQGGNIYIDRRAELLGSGALRITNSRIANSEWENQGEGARFQYRYVDRQLTNQPLLPWPMEDRVRAELGLSVDTLVTTMVNQSGGKFPPLPTPSGPTPTPPVAPSPTPSAPQTPAATPAPPQPLGYRVNAPLLAVNAGDTQLDANHWAMVSFGRVSTNDNYGDLRIVGRNDGIMLRAQLFDNRATGSDSLTVELNGVQKRVSFSTAAEANGWELGNRCQDDWCRGWSAFAFFPWSDFGGKPGEGAVWPLRVVFADADSNGATSQATWPPVGNGTVRWGLPGYGGRNEAGAQTLKTRFNADSMVGGGTDCGPDDHPDYFPSWGNRNYGAVPYANTQMQWDIADWPCYAKYYASWSLADLPAGAQVISATVEMRQFGNPGYGSGYSEDGTKDTVIQVFDVDKAWDEMSISWDNAPVPMENTARTLVKPIDVTCGGKSYCSPGIPYTFDVTEIVRRAQADGRGWASLALYTAAGQYHSGKFFWSREGQEPPLVSMAYVMGIPAQPQPLPDSPVLLFLPAVKGGHD